MTRCATGAISRWGREFSGETGWSGRTGHGRGQLEVVKYLLALGVAPNPKDRWGYTPLDDSLRHGQDEAVAILQLKGGQRGLYDRLGGQNAINAAVDLFYDKVLKDDRINHFFDGVDVARQRDHQKAFLTAAFGGPNTYTGKDLGEAHKQLAASGLDDAHFDAVVWLLSGRRYGRLPSGQGSAGGRTIP